MNRSSPPRPTRKKKNAVSEKHKTPTLTAPLSVLTKDMTNVPVRDMEAWVKRSTEERMKEAEKRNGYITRPMNSFMLYRSAYAERTKTWCLHNNHQIVSSVSGESWPLEPPEVREFYNELARIERMNHQNAHPNYKFSPSKPGVAASNKKRARTESDNESEPSDLDDPDWGAGNGMRNRPAKRPGRDAGYPARANLGDAQQHFHEMHNRPSAWDQRIRPPPVAALPYQQMPHQQQFYPSPTMQHHHMQMMPQQDPYASFDNNSFPTNQSLIGVPGGSHIELLGLHSGAPTPMMEHQVDPMLLAFDDRHHSGLTIEDGLTLTQHGEYDQGFDHHFADQAVAVSYPTDGAGGPLITDYRPREWQPDSQSPAFEQASEFDKLWDEHEQSQSLERKTSLKSHMEEHAPVGKVEDSLKSPKTA
jgi:hypothetical protein